MAAMNPEQRDKELAELREHLKEGPYGKHTMMGFNAEHAVKSFHDERVAHGEKMRAKHVLKEHENPYWDKK